jgi:putative nucleotidyltransferase with HDIG domain
MGGVMARKLLMLVQGVLFAAALTAAVMTSRTSDWRPLGLVIGLTVLMFVSEALAIESRSLRLSGGFIAVVLAMALLGPGPALAMQFLTITVDLVRRRLPWDLRRANIVSFTVYPVVGALLVRGLSLDDQAQLSFVLGIFGVFFVTNAVNFSLIAGPFSITNGVPFLTQLRTLFLPMLPAEALAGVLTATIAVTYRSIGATALAALVIVLFLFQVLTRELLLSQHRAEQLENRSTQLASLQVGVLSAMLQTLSLRDRMTARHSAAVARYARAIATEIGCSATDQELVHTAGLLHDIGKFAFPDRILLANRKLDEDDWNIVRTHPYQGARLVRRIDGYGPVAEIILAHHERVDGRGYPRGLTGEDIPLFSRMISIADTYDVMTARDSYRSPVSQAEAIAELRRVSGAQLDGDLVETFISILERRELAFQHTTDADFELELDFEGRVRGYSLPQAA